MTFLQLILRDIQTSIPKLVFVACVGGISNAAILATINAAAQAADDIDGSLVRTFAFFLVFLFLFIKAQLYVTTTIIAEIEAIIHRLRIRLLENIRHSELLVIERLGRARFVAAISGDAVVLTQAGTALGFSAQAPILIVFVGIYIAYLSLVAFVLSVVIIGAAVTMFYIRSQRLTAQKAVAAEQERQLFDRLADFLDGFKEVRLNADRSADLFDDAVDVSRQATNSKIMNQSETFRSALWSQSYLYLLLGAVVFVTPQFSKTLGSASLTEVTTALLYVIGACFGLVQSIPVLLNANAAAGRMDELDTALHAAAASSEADTPPALQRFDKIEMRNIRFHYVEKSSDTGFQIGPIDFTLRSGEIVFITGGNGSGKSTFLKVLAGLYPPDSGDITIDGMPVNDETRNLYRSLMSAIFFDYHLFHRLYGLPEQDPDEVGRLLAMFGLADKTGLSHGEFSTLDLSGGQRRRLALIVSLLEKRPIILLDEWTAEQDPGFRRKFYDELLPEMKRAGATIVVITHDDRYLDELHLPARRIRMDEGRIVDEREISG